MFIYSLKQIVIQYDHCSAVLAKLKSEYMQSISQKILQWKISISRDLNVFGFPDRPPGDHPSPQRGLEWTYFIKKAHSVVPNPR